MRALKVVKEAGTDYIIFGLPIFVSSAAFIDYLTMNEIGVVHIIVYLFILLCTVMCSLILWSNRKDNIKDIEKLKDGITRIQMKDAKREVNEIRNHVMYSSLDENVKKKMFKLRLENLYGQNAIESLLVLNLISKHEVE